MMIATYILLASAAAAMVAFTARQPQPKAIPVRARSQRELLLLRRLNRP